MVVERWIEVLVTDRRGREVHVFIDPGGDHVVTKFIINPRGDCFEAMLPHGSWAYDRAVLRAQRGAAFL